MRTNYVLIDFESVQPESLETLIHDHFKVIVFVGANQTKLPFELANSLQNKRYINHVAFRAGSQSLSDPEMWHETIA